MYIYIYIYIRQAAARHGPVVTHYSGTVRHAKDRHGTAWPGTARHAKRASWHGTARHGTRSRLSGTARHGTRDGYGGRLWGKNNSNTSIRSI